MKDRNAIIVALVLVAVGVAIVIMLNRSPTKPKAASGSSVGLNASTLGGLFSLAGGLFSSGKSTAPSMGAGSGAASSTWFAPVGSTDTAAQQSYAISHGVTDVEGNQIIDQNTGNALTYGTD